MRVRHPTEVACRQSDASTKKGPGVTAGAFVAVVKSEP
jgi:hypothetical protein